MTGIASLVLAYWAAFFPPADLQAGRALLWIASVVCFVIASYRVWARERSMSEAQVALLKDEIDKLKEYKLTFEIDIERTRVKVDESPMGCYIDTHIRLRFDNTDTECLAAKDLRLTLQERTDNSDMQEVKSKPLANLVFFPDDDLGPLTRKKFEVLRLEKRELTDYYWFRAELATESLKMTDLISDRHFLRLTMEAQDQPPFPADIDIDWLRAGVDYVRVSNIRYPKQM